MKNPSPLIGWFLLFIAVSLYLFGIYFAIFNATPQAGGTDVKLPDVFDTLTASIGAILLTNLGAVLGISVSQPNSGLAGKTLMASANVPAPMTQRETIQFIAVLVYLVALVACFIAWAVNSFREKPEPIAALVSQNGKMLIGVISAYVAFVLAK